VVGLLERGEAGQEMVADAWRSPHVHLPLVLLNDAPAVQAVSACLQMKRIEKRIVPGS
jgi:hypothetical protein